MKRTLLTFMLAIGMVANIWADTVIEGIKYALSDRLIATVTGLDDPSFTGTVTIPKTIIYYGRAYQVVQIGDKAFFEYKFKSVVIPNSVTSIGGSAFEGCTGMTSVTIGNSVTSIGEYAFRGCTGLTSVNIPNSVTNIGYAAFNNCTGLTSVTIPNSVTSIGGSAFSGCTGLTSVTIPNSVTSIGYSAFSGCTGLTSVTIPNSVTSIGAGAFENCTGLTSIDIPNSVRYIGNDRWDIRGSAFSGCTGLTAINVDENNTTYSSIDGVVFNKSKTELVQYPGGKQGAYTIPNFVTSIGDWAFIRCTALTSVTIPNSVTSIGERAFAYCTGLTSIDIPNSVTSIGDYVFWNCSGLASVTIPNSVTSIGEYSFRGCTGLTSVTIPNSVTSIGSYAFSGCTNLTSVTINSNAIMSKTYSWYNESNLSTIFGDQVQTYLIGDSVTSIGGFAFRGCTGLTSITIPNSVTSIGNHAFEGCTSLTSVTIPNSVTSIGGSAFYDCTGLTKVIINDIAAWYNISFENADSNPLYYAKHLYSDENTEITDLVIPNGVTNIKGYTFYNCTGLTSVTIPNSVTSIENDAFEGCTGLKDIYCHIEEPLTYTFSNVIKNTCTLHVPLGSKEKYKADFLWEDFLNIVEDLPAPSSFAIGNIKYRITSGSTVRVSEGETLTGELVIPESVEYEGKQYSVMIIGYYAFRDCTGLTSVTIPNSVENIENGAFSGCTGLTSVTIPNSVTSIGANVFSGCTALTSVTINSNAIISKVNLSLSAIFGNQVKTYIIGDSVTSIGDYAFSGCTGMTSVTIGNGVTSIGIKMFEGCTGLTSVTIGNSVTSIGFDAFSGCSALTSVAIPNSVTSIGGSAFSGCTDLTKVIINDIAAWCNISFANAYSNPLYYAKHLYSDENTEITDLVIPNGVTNIKGNTFYNCTGLTSVTIPNFVENIENDAFSGCTGLTYITINSNAIMSKVNLSTIFGNQVKTYIIGDSVTSIGFYAFRGCTGRTSVTIGNSVTSIGYKVFEGCTGLTSVTIGNSVTSIGEYAFSGCTALTSIDIPNSVTSIENRAFENCTGLTSVTIGNSVTSIGRYAFEGCTSLTSIEIPNSVTSIGEYAFRGCTSLTSIDIPNSVTSIKNRAFENCTGLTSVTIGNSVTSIGEYAFRGCTSLTSVIIPNSVENIENGAFSGCTGLTSVTIGNSVTSIGGSAFSDCTGLTKVIINDIAAWCNISFANKYSNPLYYVKHLYSDENTEITDLVIPNGVTNIKGYTFYNCTGLTSVTIPNSVTSIGDYAFEGCTGLKDIYCHVEKPLDIDYIVFDNVPTNTCTLHVPLGCKEKYKAAIVWEDFLNIVEDLPAQSFTIGNLKYTITSESTVTVRVSEGKTLTGELVIPETVEFGGKQYSVSSIGVGAFYYSGLISVTIPKSVTSIGEDAFTDNENLIEINVDENNTNYSSIDGVLLNKSQTELIVCPQGKQGAYTVPNSVENIENGAFSGCTGLTSVTIGNSVTSIGIYAFYNCTGLTDIYCHIEEPLTIESSVFEDVPKITCTLHVPIGSKEKYEVADVWKEFNIVEDLPTGIVSIDNSQSTIDNDVWFTLNGVRLNGKPTIPGIYIVNGLKVVIK